MLLTLPKPVIRNHIAPFLAIEPKTQNNDHEGTCFAFILVSKSFHEILHHFPLKIPFRIRELPHPFWKPVELYLRLGDAIIPCIPDTVKFLAIDEPSFYPLWPLPVGKSVKRLMLIRAH